MPWLAAAAPYIGLALSAAGTIAQGKAQREAGQTQQVAAQHRAAVGERDAQAQDIQAGQERAVGQRNLISERKNQARVESTIRTRAAASGAGALDPTIVDILGDVGSEGDFRALSALYEGEDRARALEFGAGLSRAGAGGELFAGAAARDAGRRAQRELQLSAGGTLLQGGGSFYSKYGRRETRPSPTGYGAGFDRAYNDGQYRDPLA